MASAIAFSPGRTGPLVRFLPADGRLAARLRLAGIVTR